MAWYVDKARVKAGKSEFDHWKAVHKPGEVVPNSGIYWCTACGKERACNEGDPFPPQNHHQQAPGLPAIQWQLLVRAET